MNRARGRFARIGNGRGFMPRQMPPFLPIISKSPAKRRARVSSARRLIFRLPIHG
ncbi:MULTISPECIES: hypothetical protein [Kingella]|uniref:Uncharacterized protein n=1 Tax=Kingella bonacorsii TaxID=2796361 RepID=A0ABS1BTH9_9NEIS|nr:MULTISPECIES: hypothetical protein [Kingella]MBK0396605.1 hypothetical protein [Kingella bonacorsii]